MRVAFAILSSALLLTDSPAQFGSLSNAWQTPLPRTEEGVSTPMVLEPSPDGGWFVGVDFAGSSIRILGVSLMKCLADGAVAWKWEQDTLDAETMMDVAPAPDGGCVALVTLTTIPQDGDLSRPFWDRGQRFLVIKLDANGKEQWRRKFGGLSRSMGREIHLMPDGGYLVGAMSSSPADPDPEADASSHARTSPAFGRLDVWLIRLSPVGAVEWEQSLGGLHDDRLFGSQGSVLAGMFTEPLSDLDQDLMVPLADGGALVGYTTYGGDYVAAMHLARLNARGEILWEQTFDGPAGDSVCAVAPLGGGDGGCFLAGFTQSGVGVTKGSSKLGGYDVWLIRVDDEGDVIWEITLGGRNLDALQQLIPTSDQGALLALLSSSPQISGESAFAVRPGSVDSDLWLIKVDARGRVEWAKPYGSLASEWTPFGGNVAPLPSGGCWIAVNVVSAEGGRPSGNRTLPNLGDNGAVFRDLWVFRVDGRGNKLAEYAIPLGELRGLKSNAGGDVVLAHAPRRGLGQLLHLSARCPSPGPRLWINRRAASNIYFSAQVPCGVAFAVEASSDLRPGSWTPVINLMGTDEPQEFPMILDRQAKSQFFRLNLNPP